MNRTKLLSLLLALVLVSGIMPAAVFAAEPAVEDVGGIRTAFSSTFGKIAYEGKSYAAFRSFEDARAALGKDGGRLIFNSKTVFSEFTDIEGRAPLTFIGAGKTASASLLDFSALPEVNLSGDLAIENAALRLAKDAFLYTNGNTFRTGDNFDTYLTETYVSTGITNKTYIDPPSVSVGSGENKGGIYIGSGAFTEVSAGAAKDKTVSGNTYLHVSGGSVKKLIAGNAAGTVNGNTFTEISGGDISTAYFGAMKDAKINGNAVLSIKSASPGLVKAAEGEVSGKKIVILYEGAAANVPDSVADYIIEIKGGICTPVFDGTVLRGFEITDSLGLPATEVTVNGSKMTASDGVFAVPEGKSEIAADSGVAVSLNKNASFVSGYTDGTFGPQKNMTKAEAITLLTRTIADETKIKSIICSLSGVAADAWYAPYIGFFEKLGFLTLLSDEYGTAFSPEKSITRAEFTQLIYEIACASGKPGATQLFVIEDLSEKSAFYPAVSFAMGEGIVTGYPDGTFRPDGNITRAEVVTMVNRFMGREPLGTAASFYDVAGHWASGQIAAACGTEGTDWIQKPAAGYTLSDGGTKENIIKLYGEAATLKPDEIVAGIDTVSEKMKKDILSAKPTTELYPERIKGDVYYISEKNGNDQNDGLSPETPLKTLTAFTTKFRFVPDDTVVLFECGGIYRGTLAVSDNMTVGSYGSGEKPILMQSKKNYADPSLWEETKWEGVWKSTEIFSNVGVMAFDHDVYDHSEGTYNEKYGSLRAVNLNGFNTPKDFKKDLEFYCVYSDEGIFKTGELYLYCKSGNPGEVFESIEIGENVPIISGNGDNVVIDGLAFKFTGSHAIAIGTVKDRVVTNCVMSWLGGSVHGINDGVPYMYGNAVEVYGGCDGYRVENCWIYQIYDTGITHQFAGGTACKQENIRYYGNLVEYCFWSIEFYNNPGTGVKASEKVKYTKNVRTAYNVLNHSGYGWGSLSQGRTGYSYCCSSISANEDELTEYNIFNRCSGYLIWLALDLNEVLDKNIYVQDYGKSVGSLRGPVSAFDYTVAAAIDDILGDKNAVVVALGAE